MFELFKSYRKTHNSSDSCRQNVENESRDYQIIIGDNMGQSSTSEERLYQSQNSLCHSHSSSPESGSNQYNRIFRNYTSSPHLFLLVLFLVLYILLIFLGASVFSLFEQKAEFQIRDHILRTQQNFLAKHPSVDAESLDSFVKSVIDAMNSGVNLHELNQLVKRTQQPIETKGTTDSISPTFKYDSAHKNIIKQTTHDKPMNKTTDKSNEKSSHQLKIESKETSTEEMDDYSDDVFAFKIPTEYSNWEFTSSLLFVTSVVTTIGYGHITPITEQGKTFCLLFSCVAIPFTLVFLSIIVSLLKNGPVKIFEKWLIRTITSHFQRIPEFFIRILHVIIVTLILLLLILMLPALIFSSIEMDWTFLDSVYYCYISLTTVGLGDFVPANTQFKDFQTLQFYRICVVIYLYGGLALIMLWIAVILRIPQMNLKPFLLTEKEDIDEKSNVLDYQQINKQNSYGTQSLPQKS